MQGHDFVGQCLQIMAAAHGYSQSGEGAGGRPTLLSHVAGALLARLYFDPARDQPSLTQNVRAPILSIKLLASNMASRWSTVGWV
jgi:hypothetical protein